MPASLLGALVAHQGGWDEILLVAGPIVVIVVLLRIAKRRVDRGITGSDVGDGHGDDQHQDRAATDAGGAATDGVNRA